MHVHTYTNVHTEGLQTHAHAYLCTCINYMYTPMCMHRCMCLHIHTCMDIHVHADRYMCIHYTQRNRYTHMHVHAHTICHVFLAAPRYNKDNPITLTVHVPVETQ